MAREQIGELVSPESLKQESPLSEVAKTVISETNQELEKVLTGTSSKKILVIGPCSADFEDSLTEYAHRLKEMKEKYEDKIVFVMRFYTGKPRTIGGWKGIQQGPIEGENIENGVSMNDGLSYSRKLAIKLIEESGIGLADEMLHPQLFDHFDDVFSYQAIGARSVENQYHREVSSGASIAIGLKNTTSGSLVVMTNSIKAAQTPSQFTIGEKMYRSTGNELAHGILRGGENGPNFSITDIKEAYELMKKQNVKNPGILIDCSHENCKINGKKDPLRQIDVMNAVMESIKDDAELKSFVKGFMVESYIYDGNQSIPDDISQAKKGLSLTDPCIGLEGTEKLLADLHKQI